MKKIKCKLHLYPELTKDGRTYSVKVAYRDDIAIHLVTCRGNVEASRIVRSSFIGFSPDRPVIFSIDEVRRCIGCGAYFTPEQDSPETLCRDCAIIARGMNSPIFDPDHVVKFSIKNENNQKSQGRSLPE